MKGSEAQKQRPHELLWMLWFDEKSISNVVLFYSYIIRVEKKSRLKVMTIVLVPFLNIYVCCIYFLKRIWKSYCHSWWKEIQMIHKLASPEKLIFSNQTPYLLAMTLIFSLHLCLPKRENMQFLFIKYFFSVNVFV